MMKQALAIIACISASGCAVAPSFDLQGHRGSRGLAPENTLPAFAMGLGIGVTTLEMDAAITKDDVVVVSHNPALDPDITRGPDGQWLAQRGPLIRDLTFAQLQRYDVGRIKPEANYAKTFSDQVPLDGTRIPKVSDVFDLVKRSGNREVQFDIETKVFPLAPGDTLAPEPFARRLVEEIRKAGMGARTMIQSFDWRTLAIVQKEAREMRTVYLTAQQRFLDNICTGPGSGNPAIARADSQPSEVESQREAACRESSGAHRHEERVEVLFGRMAAARARRLPAVVDQLVEGATFDVRGDPLVEQVRPFAGHPRCAQVPFELAQVMDDAARSEDENAFVAKNREGAAERGI